MTEQAVQVPEDVLKVATFNVMEQYVQVQESAKCNMMDLGCVQVAADAWGFHALASLTRDEYLVILRHYGALIKYYGLNQGG